MGRRRGFFAELNRQAKLAERDRARRLREADRRYKAAVRESERQRKEEERAYAQAAKAAAADRKRWEQEAKLAHIASMEAEVERLNAEAESVADELANILAATLEVDDYVDLEALRRDTSPPPYPSPELERFDPGPAIPPPLPKPDLALPEKPTGLTGVFRRGKHKREVLNAENEHSLAVQQWEAMCKERETQLQERTRLVQAAYLEDVHAHNAKLDELINNLAYGVPAAVDEYVSIVLANSVYPDCFPVDYEYAYDAASAELSLTALIPAPKDLPTKHSFKYTKSKDEISSKDLTARVQKDRYASAVHQVALRTLHEVFEADRRGLIKSISLEVATETVDPATGNDTRIPFVAVAAERASFESINLARVAPDATLAHLGASISKNPFDLVATDASGIRRA